MNNNQITYGDIDVIGEAVELTDEQLRLVAGGLPRRNPWVSKTIDLEVGMTDVDAGF